MFSVTLKTTQGHLVLNLGGPNLTSEGPLLVSYLTREMIVAFQAGIIDISPPPTMLSLTSGILTDNTGGSNLGAAIVPIVTMADVNSAFATIIDNSNRMTLDLQNLADDMNELKSQLLDVQSAIS